jgi:SAM-dependent methyltransferase
MENLEKKKHWEGIYTNKTHDQMSWYQPVPKKSIEFFESFTLPKDARIIDVGAGDSYFVDYLLDKGYINVYVLDISSAAIERAKKRLGMRSHLVNWIVSDILDFAPDIKFDFWHDRATFHFLNHPQQIGRYISIAGDHVLADKYMVVGTFSDTGPLKCSGIEITQYSKEQLAEKFAGSFEKIKCINDKHETPFHTFQDFTFCSFQKKHQ